jgi:hypothetical protein
MKNNKITYEQLQTVLLRLGYTADAPSSNCVVYRHPDSDIDVILRRMRRREILQPIDLLSVQNALANGGIVPKEQFDSLFQRSPVELWHAIIDAEAEYLNQHGQPANVLKLPVLQAYDLAKLPRSEIGPVADEVMRRGIKVFEEKGLPGVGIPVKLVPDGGEFTIE